jgi:glycine/D-amino acid oxidase-like deaminating enzyme
MGAAAAHDVIVVGARVAGSATAMLLARAGLQVLLLDRVRFPGDTRLAPLNRARRALLTLVAGDPRRAAALFAALSGAAPWQQFMTPWGAFRNGIALRRAS